MFGSNGPCPTLGSEYLPQFDLLEPIYYACDQQQQQQQQFQVDSSETEYHSSASPTPDIISELINLGGPSCPSESSGSYGDLTSPEDYCQSTSPPDYMAMSCSPPMEVPGVQATRTKLIKEGLKLTIQSKRIVNGLDTLKAEYKSPPRETLTKEDEERRRRRRERNKVAATKCRNKKKERTGRLAVESEALVANNNALMTEIQSLEKEKKDLAEILSHHLPNCGLPTSRSSCAKQHHPQPFWPSAVLG